MTEFGSSPIELRVDRLRELLGAAFEAAGVQSVERERIIDALIEAELHEVPSHGVLRVPGYLKAFRTGRYNAQADIRIVERSAVVSLIEGDGALGYLPTWLAMDSAARSAEREGIGIAGVRNIAEFGRAAYYAKELAQRGFVSLVSQNTPPLLGSPGSTRATHGNNPLAFAAPGEDAPVFDAAFSPRSGGELLRRKALGQDIPEDWGYTDEAGTPITDPALAWNSVWPAVGGGKGFGLAVMVDLFAGVLTGSGNGPSIVRGLPQTGAFVMALDPDVFGHGSRMDESFAAATDAVRSSGGRWPGDRGRLAHAGHSAKGTIVVAEPTFNAARDAVSSLVNGLDLAESIA